LDEGVGRLLQTLKTTGLERDTLLFFINDNGGATSNGSDNGPLRGMKGSKWEGGIRVPFMVKWPARLKGNRTFDKPVISLDIQATAIAAAGGEPDRQPKRLDGVNLIPFLTGKNPKAPHNALFWRRGVAAAVRQGPWKLIRSETNPPILVNLDDDLGETRNLASGKPRIVERLSGLLSAWEKGLAPPKWREGERWSQNQIQKHRMDVIGRDAERKLP
jgi:arylsulfatase A-like enzyme